MSDWDVVLRGGRVIDPESGFDAVADVAVADRRVVQIGAGVPGAPTDVDAAGLVVTGGFIDRYVAVRSAALLAIRTNPISRISPSSMIASVF
jgi:predicted amidohydrolase